MEKNEKDALLALIGGSIAIVVLISIFTNWLEFGLAIVIAGVLIIMLITLSMYYESSPETRLQRAVIGFMIGLGVEIILISIFMEWIDFGLAVIISVTIWILTAAVGSYLGIDDIGQVQQRFSSRVDSYRHSTRVNEQQIPYNSQTYEPKKGQASYIYCHSCGDQLEEDTLFCPNCGTRVE